MDMDFIKNLNIINNKDISKKLIEIAEYVKSKEDLAEERLRKLEEYDKEEEIAKLKKEIEHLRRNSVAIMSDKEKELYKTFSRRHNEKCGSRSSEIRGWNCFGKSRKIYENLLTKFYVYINM